MILTVTNDDVKKRTLIIVVIEADNFERMKKADPLWVTSSKIGAIKKIDYPDNLDLLICYEEDNPKLYELAQTGHMANIMKYLIRGLTHQSGDGVVLPLLPNDPRTKH